MKVLAQATIAKREIEIQRREPQPALGDTVMDDTDFALSVAAMRRGMWTLIHGQVVA